MCSSKKNKRGEAHVPQSVTMFSPNNLPRYQHRVKLAVAAEPQAQIQGGAVGGTAWGPFPQHLPLHFPLLPPAPFCLRVLQAARPAGHGLLSFAGVPLPFPTGRFLASSSPPPNIVVTRERGKNAKLIAALVSPLMGTSPVVLSPCHL